MRFGKCQQPGFYCVIREVLRTVRATRIMTRGVGDDGASEERVIVGELVIKPSQYKIILIYTFAGPNMLSGPIAEIEAARRRFDNVLQVTRHERINLNCPASRQDSSAGVQIWNCGEPGCRQRLAQSFVVDEEKCLIPDHGST